MGVCSNTPLLADNVLLFSRNTVTALNLNSRAITPHRRYVLCLCLEVSGSVFIGHQRIDLKPNQALLIPPFRFHYYDCIDSADLNWAFLTFDTKSQNPLLSEELLAITFDHSLRERFAKLCQLFRSLPETKENHRFLMEANVFLYDLLTQRPDKIGEQFPQLSPNRPSLAQRLQLILEANPDITISEIARKMGRSEGHLRHEFKKRQNMTLSHYVNNFRLHYSIELLHQREKTLLDIAYELGFSSQASFTRFFKRMTQRTPAKFRKETLGL